ncbi:MAG TPA: ABC transporter permease [Actinomycetota bacterium]|nr:ABC transporter permease [Actinomycetota bacterium]
MSINLSTPTAAAEVPDIRRTRGGFLWQVIKDRPSAAVGAGILLLFIAISLLAPYIEPFGLRTQVGPVFCRPSAKHLLGCDDGGIDMVSLLIQGGRISLAVGFAATLVAVIIGGGVGILAGYFGGATDIVLMRITDYFLVIPDVPLMIILAALLGPSVRNIILVIGILLWTQPARIIRAQVKSVRERVYVKRARSLGASNTRIILKHVLPQIAPLLIANTVITIAIAIFDETALDFLGLGDPSAISWGTILEHAFVRTAISSGAWWAVIPEGVCVTVVIMGCYLLGQAVEDALNPRLKVAHLSVRRFRMRPLGALGAALGGARP